MGLLATAMCKVSKEVVREAVESVEKLMTEGFGQVNGQLDSVDGRLDHIEKRWEHHQRALDKIKNRKGNSA